jgi:hypothetical protein
MWCRVFNEKSVVVLLAKNFILFLNLIITIKNILFMELSSLTAFNWYLNYGQEAICA